MDANNYEYGNTRRETRILSLDPRYIDTVPSSVIEWNGKEVTAVSWHELCKSTKTAKMFPNETLVGFVREFCLDIPACELRRIDYQGSYRISKDKI